MCRCSLCTTSGVKLSYAKWQSYHLEQDACSWIDVNPFILAEPKVSETKFYYHIAEFNFNDKLHGCSINSEEYIRQ